jgi:phosphohistidine phosphatase
MKTLYLLRHAKSSRSDPGLRDIDRPLNGRGRRAAAGMGAYMNREGLVPDLILCSTARRTVETLERLAPELAAKIPDHRLEALYLAEAKDILDVLRHLPAAAKAVLVIGHNPGLHELALRLASKGEKRAMSRLAAAFPTGALAVLGCPGKQWSELATGSARLDSFVRPRDLDGGGEE